MKPLLVIFLVFISLFLRAQEQQYVVKVIDYATKQEQIALRYTVSDSSNQVITRGIITHGECFHLTTAAHFVQILLDSTIETCDGKPMGGLVKIRLDTVRDTIRIPMGHAWYDYEARPLYFDNGAMTFTEYPDSTERCSFENVDTTCSGFGSLKVLEYYYRCGPISKLEIRTYYTSYENKLYGDSLAKLRAMKIENWLSARGVKNLEYVVVPILYSTRPLKRADGDLELKEHNVILFRILEW